MKRIIAFLLIATMFLALTSCELLSIFKGGETYTDYVRCSSTGVPDENGDYVLFGEYPQSLKSPEVEITEEVDSRGYYLGNDGEYYARVRATPYGEDYTFLNGETIVAGEVYYFKLEPIIWKILNIDDGKALILSKDILDGVGYQMSVNKVGKNVYATSNGAPSGTYANNYEYSEARAFLNGEFLSVAFTETKSELIVKTTVNNDAGNVYSSADTEDKIFLPSYSEMENESYGFTTSAKEADESRVKITTDYARAVGTLMKTDAEILGNGTYWLRTPIGDATNTVHRIDTVGKSDSGYVNREQYGIAPALILTLK